MDKNYYLGLDIGGTKLAVVLSDLNYNIISRKSCLTLIENAIKPPAKNIELLHEMISDILSEQKLIISNIKGIGVSCGGPLNSKKGIIISPPNLQGWNNVDIVSILTEKYNIPVFLKHDANAGALAEYLIGYKKKYKDLIFLTFGTGMGAGIIINGKVHIGVNNFAGEVGHIRLADNGPVGFGKKGSFEGFCSGGGIANLLNLRLQNNKLKTELCEGMSAKDIAEYARKGDLLAIKIYEEVGIMLGKGLALLIDILNPQAIIIGSIYGRAKDLLQKTMMEELKNECLDLSLKNCKILQTSLGEQIGDYASLITASGKY